MPNANHRCARTAAFGNPGGVGRISRCGKEAASPSTSRIRTVPVA